MSFNAIMAVRALRINAAKVRALLESILITKENSVSQNLVAQEFGAAFKLDDVDWTRQDLQQVTNAPEQSACRKSFHSKIEV